MPKKKSKLSQAAKVLGSKGGKARADSLNDDTKVRIARMGGKAGGRGRAKTNKRKK